MAKFSNTDIYATAIADGRTRFYGEVRVRPIVGFSAYRSLFQTYKRPKRPLVQALYVQKDNNKTQMSEITMKSENKIHMAYQ